MSVVPIDIAAARTAVDEVSSEVEELLRSIPDTSVPVPGLEWTAGETGAHIVTVTNCFDDYVTGRKKPPVTTGEIPTFNADGSPTSPNETGHDWRLISTRRCRTSSRPQVDTAGMILSRGTTTARSTSLTEPASCSGSWSFTDAISPVPWIGHGRSTPTMPGWFWWGCCRCSHSMWIERRDGE